MITFGYLVSMGLGMAYQMFVAPRLTIHYDNDWRFRAKAVAGQTIAFALLEAFAKSGFFLGILLVTAFFTVPKILTQAAEE